MVHITKMFDEVYQWRIISLQYNYISFLHKIFTDFVGSTFQYYFYFQTGLTSVNIEGTSVNDNIDALIEKLVRTVRLAGEDANLEVLSDRRTLTQYAVIGMTNAI